VEIKSTPVPEGHPLSSTSRDSPSFPLQSLSSNPRLLRFSNTVHLKPPPLRHCPLPAVETVSLSSHHISHHQPVADPPLPQAYIAGDVVRTRNRPQNPNFDIVSPSSPPALNRTRRDGGAPAAASHCHRCR
jgi:hypothetical protein